MGTMLTSARFNCIAPKVGRKAVRGLSETRRREQCGGEDAGKPGMKHNTPHDELIELQCGRLRGLPPRQARRSNIRGI
jgi:hypothetical protein